uniref:Ras-associating domain-containing protein n=1 Tax=Macrostomum lignano TaxID=282301 RepID=A0A1I8F847_9PLAT
TLQFARRRGERPPELKIACDSSGRYVVLTDSTRRLPNQLPRWLPLARDWQRRVCPDSAPADGGPQSPAESLHNLRSVVRLRRAPSSPAAAASSGPASAAATPRSLGNSHDVDLLLASGSSAAGSGGFGRAGTAVDSSTVTIVTD